MSYRGLKFHVNGLLADNLNEISRIIWFLQEVKKLKMLSANNFQQD